MPRRKKAATTGDASNALGAAFAPMIRAIVREEIGAVLSALARQYGAPEAPAHVPDAAPITAPEASRNGRDKRGKADASGEQTSA